MPSQNASQACVLASGLSLHLQVKPGFCSWLRLSAELDSSCEWLESLPPSGSVTVKSFADPEPGFVTKTELASDSDSY